ncbi:MAG: hypothetical protein CMJ78_12805 [Planctomycetaceae bacterium]|nr:hypothetical protein [Planctomycetaceae bacterium]
MDVGRWKGILVGVAPPFPMVMIGQILSNQARPWATIDASISSLLSASHLQQRETPMRRLPLLTILMIATLNGVSTAQERAGVEFFEKRIRPILVNECYSCHSSRAKSLKGGLRLDSRAAMRKGGETGAAVVPKDVDGSLLIEALRHESLEMPPGKKLPKRVIEDFIQWIKIGAPDPRDKPDTKPLESDNAAAKEHWAFQPIRVPSVPKFEGSGSLKSDVDRFIQHRLNEAKLSMAAPADRVTLARRAYFDLIGLPPTPAEVKEFVDDDSPDAFAKLVDRLLESPHYGERWGRLWLDVARYADNKGYVFFEDKNFHWAWTYRDYVVRAFNEDVPFDQFVLEQIAADQLPLDKDKRALAAMGFLTLGARFMNNTHDVVDDRIDVVTRGLMGLTVSCARCHDHKYDPVLQSDYYGLYGVFRSSIEPFVPPEFAPSPTTPEYQKFAAGLKERIDKLGKFLDEQRTMITNESRSRAAEYLMAVHAKRNHPITENFMLLTDKGALNPAMIHRWEVFLKRARRAKDPVWSLWEAFSDLENEDFTEQAKSLYQRLLGKDSKVDINPLIRAAFADKPPATMKEVADRYGKVLAQVDKQWKQELAKPRSGKKFTRLPDDAAEAIRQAIYGMGSPPMIPRQLSWGFLDLLPDRPTQGVYKKLVKDVETWSRTQPGAPARAMVLVDGELFEPAIFIRGNPNREGQQVPRRYPRFLSKPSDLAFQSGSGRLELAMRIVAKDNPLTARVFVNRVWQHHFGRGLVSTPSDFGLRSEPPSHPDLLDWLAVGFQRDWSVKNLHRTMMNTTAYQQSSRLVDGGSRDLDHHRNRDPENRLLWHFNRRRLDFESMRDALITVTGSLNRSVGGPPTNVLAGFNSRRTMYGFVNRMDLPGLMRAFDFPDPAASSPGREQTTIAPQALFFLNHDFVIGAASRIRKRAQSASPQNSEQQIAWLYEQIFSRKPTAQEIELGQAFLKRPKPAETSVTQAAWKYGYAALDEKTQKISGFTELKYWTGKRWQVGPSLPDPNLGWVFIDRVGGHPSATLQRCSVRRWVAPAAGTIIISSHLKHVPTEGNGVRGRLIHSRSGQLGQWTAHHSETKHEPIKTKVSAGETIDFVTEFMGNLTHDEHEWRSTIRYEATESKRFQSLKWNSEVDFSGGTLDGWVNYVHALLMTNEFVFVD